MIVVQCVCGATKEVLPSNLGSGDTRSCGCLQKKKASEANTKHGAKSKTASSTQKDLMSVWRGMRNRCYNPNARNYKWYGHKGVQIDWVDFNAFYTWAISHGYTKGLELDRIDPNLNYSPDNCMWCSKSDNIARAHLKIDENIKTQVTTLAKNTGTSFSDVVESALRSYLSASQEVMGNGN